MERPIAVGDLVQVVLPLGCGCNGLYLGKVFVVKKIRTDPKPGPFICAYCGKTTGHDEDALWSDDYGVRRSRCKRIPPLSELTETRTDETIGALAWMPSWKK